ncbi:MAG: cation transporter [Candidatus Lokiarchaeota archaeon]|nr:cation transporter [Candidatus Lokiarchaeota archaeon]
MTDNNTFSDHLFQFRSVEKKRLVISLIITVSVMVIEIIGGFMTNSIALISDAGHMFTHSFAISISLLAMFIARKPPCHHKTFGLYRAEVLAAFINGLFLLIIVGLIIYEAILRFLNPIEILGSYMLIVAIIGLAVNVSSILILQGSKKKSLNVKSVFYHMIADAASSVGIVIVAIVISYTGFIFLDPLVSLGISFVILYWAWNVLKESTRILLEIAPKGIDINDISRSLKNQFPDIIDMINAHFWTITPDMLVFTAHILIDNEKIKENQDELLSNITEFLKKEYNVIESTVQLFSTLNSETCET